MNSTDRHTPGKEILTFFALIMVGLYFFIDGIMAATGFLIPITVSILLALICIPLARKLENVGLNRGFSSLICVLVSFIAFVSFFVLISFQITQFSDKWPEIKNKAKTGLESAEDFISKNTGFSFQKDIDQVFAADSEEPSSQLSDTDGQTKAEERVQENSQPDRSAASDDSLISKVPTGLFSRVGGVVISFFGFLANSALAMIYLFFLLYYRTKLKLSILNFFSDENQSNAKDVLADTIKLALDFLIGRMILIAFLALIYGIGLSISGIDNAILISILAAILSLIPYVGNIIGLILAMSMAAFSGGGLGMYIGVAATYFFAQFIESYILQPFVVGGKVNINPIVTIIVVVLGGTIWGVAGMILSIPIIGIFKIVCDAVPVLQPVGYFLGEEDLGSDDEEPGKLKQWGKKIWSKISGK
ncbi:AI-2E family transporter [Algoriphagus antarcticus]|uniref:Putative PurR-regulated permease PerM n=1 Tax=Algoriphagus antarcticus TaxID=238540 RepID=A0A3E0DL39_9BACT|nr:AI-2E family transporter [Algoriphagus antarcticus]REG83413.1 putative PurR-regulated permease PerM [Algoriphagus antarcticus]